MGDITLLQIHYEHKGKVSDKWALYLTEYERIFSKYRMNTITMLEVGVQNGGSLDIWSKYFQNGKQFIGCDINCNCSKLNYDDARISLVIGDANEDAVQAKILKHSNVFDIVIDDGSHLSGDIVKSFVRYFPKVVNGGVYVVEDLHCSYWHEFDGGLFDPFSSITFFKSLVDVINHEHWGLDKNRADILNGFVSRYDFELTDEFLDQIHSIEFINSICVIRKSSLQENVLGERCVTGEIDEVFPGLQELHLDTPSQENNFWSLRNIPPAEELPIRLHELNECNEQLERLQQTVIDMRRSHSWRLTVPLRSIGSIIRKILHSGR